MLNVHRRWLIGVLALVIAGGVVTVGVVVGASDTTFEDTTTTDEPRAGSDRDKKARSDHRPPVPEPGKDCRRGPIGHTEPAGTLSEDAAWIPGNIHFPVNAWRAGDCRRLTFVWAGADGGKRSTGRFILERHGDWPKARMMLVIDIPDSGAVRITAGPRGPEVISSAQRNGVLEFTSNRGVTGTVNLTDDTVTLSTGEVIEAMPYG